MKTKILRNIKKISFIGVGALLLGATIVSAGSLSSFPSPFVKNGTYSSVIVIGEKAATSDVIGAVDIATMLQYNMAQKVKTSINTPVANIEGGAKIENSGQKLYLGDYVAVTKTILTDSDLPGILKKGTIEDSDGGEYTYTLKINTPTNSKLLFGKDVISGYDSDTEPIVYLDLNGNTKFYSTEITFPVAVEPAKLTNKKITLFGKEYTFSANTNELDPNDKIVLYGGGTQKVMTAGEEYNLIKEDGLGIKVKIVGIQTGSNPSAWIEVNGESRQVTAGNTYTVGNEKVYIKQIFSYTVPTTQGAIDLFIGSDKLSLYKSNTVEKGNNEIYGAASAISITGSNKISSIKITVTPYSMDDQIKYIGEKQEFVDPVFGSFKFMLGAAYPTLADTSKEEIQFYPSADDKVTAEFKNKNGQKYSLSMLNYTGPNYGLEINERQVAAGAYGSTLPNIKEEDYFMIGTASNQHILRLERIDTGNHKIKIRDAASGGTSQEVSYSSNAGEVSLDGYAYSFAVSESEYYINITGGINYVITENGAKIDFSDLINSKITIKEETAYNDGDFNSNTGTQLGGDIIVTLGYDAGATYHTTTSVSGNPSITLIGTNNNEKKALTPYGTFIKYTSGSGANKVVLKYPKSAVYYNLFVAPTVSIIETQEAGTIDTLSLTKIPIKAALTDTEVLASDPGLENNNYIVVGGPCVNTVAAKLLGSTGECTLGFEEGKAKIKLFERANGKFAMLVAGYSATDTVRACRAIGEDKLKGIQNGEATVTTVSEATTITGVSS